VPLLPSCPVPPDKDWAKPLLPIVIDRAVNKLRSKLALPLVGRD